MSLSAQDLYALLPAMLRTADEANGAPLRALIGVIAEQTGVLDDNMRAFYSDQFIETCSPWVVPYIGDLIGWSGLIEGVPGANTSRAEVANTIGYRRRKGTVIALEQLAQDVTQRPARVVEFFRRLAVTQSMHHLRPKHAGFADLRRGNVLERIGTAFDETNRTIEVRGISPIVEASGTTGAAPLAAVLHGGGRFNIPDLGAFVWRWKPYQVTSQPAGIVDARRYTFSPLGQIMPLFNAVPVRSSFAALTTRMDVSQPITRREMAAKLGNFYGNAPIAGPLNTTLPPSVAVYSNGTLVPPSAISVCNLTDTANGGWAVGQAGLVAIDPELGRIAFPANAAAPTAVTVDYTYGFPMDLGGGPYPRSDTAPTLTRRWQVTVGTGGITGLAQAVAEFNAQPADTAGRICLPGYTNLTESLTGSNAIQIPAGSTLEIVSVNAAAPPQLTEQSRATILGDIAVVGIAGSDPAASQAQVTLNGVLIAGSITLSSATNVGLTLALSHCTVVPGHSLLATGQPRNPAAPAVTVASGNGALQLDHCISGPLYVHAAASARVISSFVDANSRFAVAYAGPDGASEGGTLHAEEATIIGKVHTHLMELASNTLFVAARGQHDPWPVSIWCTRQQAGCLRFSALPADATVPRMYRCIVYDTPGDATLAPQFVTLEYGQPSYGLMSGACPAALWLGADDESQIGAYHDLYEPQGVANLRARLAEYAPFALESGIFLIPSRAGALLPSGLPYGYTPTAAELDTLESAAIGLALL